MPQTARSRFRLIDRRRNDQDIGRIVVERPCVVAHQATSRAMPCQAAKADAGDDRLHVVGAEQDDDEIERRMRLQDRRQHPRAVAVAVGEMVVEGGGAAVQAFGDDPSLTAERRLQHARPAVLIGMTADGFGIIAPGQGIAVAENGLVISMSVQGSDQHAHRVFDIALEGAQEFGAERAVDAAVVGGKRHASSRWRYRSRRS